MGNQAYIVAIRKDRRFKWRRLRTVIGASKKDVSAKAASEHPDHWIKVLTYA